MFLNFQTLKQTISLNGLVDAGESRCLEGRLEQVGLKEIAMDCLTAAIWPKVFVEENCEERRGSPKSELLVAKNRNNRRNFL